MTTPTADTDRPSLEGLAVTSDDRAALLRALEQAFDYRGDVTITRTTAAGGGSFTGYIFDRRSADTLEASRVRLLPPDSDHPVTIAYSDIAKVAFTGKDTAHGRTFENWITRYVEAKRQGLAAGIESEAL